MPTVSLTGHDADAEGRARVIELGLVDDMADCAAAAVTDADLIMLCVPVGAMRTVGEAIAAELPAGAVVSDVGSVKGSVLDDLRAVLPKGTAIMRIGENSRVVSTAVAEKLK